MDQEQCFALAQIERLNDAIIFMITRNSPPPSLLATYLVWWVENHMAWIPVILKTRENLANVLFCFQLGKSQGNSRL